MSDPDQHRPAYSQGFYNEHGERVPACWPDDPEPSLSERIGDALLAHGMPREAVQSAAQELAPLIQDKAQDMAVELAGEALARLVASLGNSVAGTALRHAILGDVEPLREASAKAGVSHVRLWQLIQDIRRRLSALNKRTIGV